MPPQPTDLMHIPPRTTYSDFTMKARVSSRGIGRDAAKRRAEDTPIDRDMINYTPGVEVNRWRTTAQQPTKPTKRHKFANDRLGKLIKANVAHLTSLTSWRNYVLATRGDTHIQESIKHLPHLAAHFLSQLQKDGMPALMREGPWPRSEVNARVTRGSHKSVDEHMDFVRGEMADFSAKGFWTVLPFDLVRDPPGLQISPLGCIPQCNRRPRLITDLSFYGINDETVKLAPAKAMQFGRALDWLLYQIRHADPKFGPVYLNKIDISDGFYRVPLTPDSAPRLAVVLPNLPPFFGTRKACIHIVEERRAEFRAAFDQLLAARSYPDDPPDPGPLSDDVPSTDSWDSNVKSRSDGSWASKSDRPL